MDTEYISKYTEAHKKFVGKCANNVELRAECHAAALEGLTPFV